MHHMENHASTDTTPIVFCARRDRYWSSTPIISWTSKFSESVGLQHLTYLPTKIFRQYDETWEKMTSVIDLGQLSSPSFLALEPYALTLLGEYQFLLRFRCYASSDNLNLVESSNICLNSGGGTEDNSSSDRGDSYFDYSIHCCVRPRFRGCVNDLPVEILEQIFLALEYKVSEYTPNSTLDSSYGLSKAIPLVCKLWNKVHVAFEEDPIKAKAKFARLKQLPGKRFKWNTCYYHPSDHINFDEYIRAVVQCQPNLISMEINKPSKGFTIDSLFALAKVRTLERVALVDWNFQEVFAFLRARQDLGLNYIYIENMVEENQELTYVAPSNLESQSQFTKVKSLTINKFDDSVREILNRLQKNHLKNLCLSYDHNTFEPLREPIQLFGYENLLQLELDGGNDESNLVSFDFISKTCTQSNLPNLRFLYMNCCFIDPTEIPCLLHMTVLKYVEFVLFIGQQTDQIEQMKFTLENEHQYIIRYSDGNY